MNKISQDDDGTPEENKIIQTHYAIWDNDIMRFSISKIISSPLGIRMTRPLLEEVQISLTAPKISLDECQSLSDCAETHCQTANVDKNQCHWNFLWNFWYWLYDLHCLSNSCQQYNLVR
jgi:hypothetical protein